VTDREIMQQALEALTRIWEDGLENFPESGHDAAITALRAAIEQADEQEPVAWGLMDDHGEVYDCVAPSEHAKYEGRYTVPLYTIPPAAQPAPVQVSPTDFVDMVMDKEDATGKPIFWAEWPNKEKNHE
jgi:hypothetical protein